MPYYDKEQVAKAREMDLLNYLIVPPGRSVKVSGENYLDQDARIARRSQTVSGCGGRGIWRSGTALDYLVKARGHPFTEACGDDTERGGK